MAEYLLVLTTVSDEAAASQIARQLVEERLAACVTVSSPCQSFYWWEGDISEERELILFIKTKESLYPELEKRLKEIHPYSVPEVLALSVALGSEKYLRWLDQETRQAEKQNL